MEVKNRLIYLDILRIFATVSLVVLHVSGQNFNSQPTDSFEWVVLNFYDSLVRWVVPVFVMISGSLFLRREQSIKKLYQKYILKIVCAYIFWSGVYAFVSYLKGECGLKEMVWEFFEGHYHLWFLLMIAGLYVVTPFLKTITESKTLTNYFLVVGAIVSVLIPCSLHIVPYFSERLADILNNHFSNVFLCFNFTFYYVLGYKLSTMNFKKLRKWIYLGGIAGFVCTFIFTDFLAGHNKAEIGFYYDNFSPTVLLESIFMFVLVKDIFVNKTFGTKTTKHILNLSKYSFGIYLVHTLILELLKDKFAIHTLVINPIVSVPLLTLFVFVISWFSSFVLNKIPFVNKYIV